MATVSQNIHNYNYAPGIATYGIKGNTGEAGLNGNTLFFSNMSFNSTAEFKILASQIANNYLPIKNSETTIAREYQNGDCIFTMDGVIYQLYDIENLILDETNQGVQKYNKYFQIVGRVTIDTTEYMNYLSGSQRLELNTDYNGFDVVTISSNDVSSYINEDATMNIVSDNLDEYNNINFLQMTSVNSYNSINGRLLIYFDTNDNAFHITSNDESPLVINGDIKINQDTIEQELDNYSSVLTSADPIIVFKTICSNIEYMVTGITGNDNTAFVALTLIVKNDEDNYNLMQDKFNSIKDNLFAKVYTNGTISSYFLKEVDSTKITYVASDDTTRYQIDLNEYISDTSQVKAVSLLYNTEIFLNKYNSNV